MDNVLQVASQIGILVFAALYLLSFALNRREKFTKKYVFKKTLKKQRVDIWSMEFNHKLIEMNRLEALEEIKDKDSQLITLSKLREVKEGELKVLKEAPKWDEVAIKEKIKELNDVVDQIGGQKETGKEKDGKKEIEVKGVKGDIAQLNQIIKWFERQLGELTKEISTKQLSLDAGEKLIRKIR